MKKSTKNIILSNEVAQKEKSKAKALKVKTKKAIAKALKDIEKEENTSVNIKGFNDSINASILKNVMLINEVYTYIKDKNKARILENKKAKEEGKKENITTFKNMVINDAKLSEENKQQVLKFYNYNYNYDILTNEEKAKLKALIKIIINNNISSNNNITNDAKKFFISEENKNALNNYIKRIFNIENGLGFNTLKKAILSSYTNKLLTTNKAKLK